MTCWKREEGRTDLRPDHWPQDSGPSVEDWRPGATEVDGARALVFWIMTRPCGGVWTVAAGVGCSKRARW